MVSKHGEEFKFNILTTTASFSRIHKFTYSRTRTREDLIRSLIEVFYFYGGVHKMLLTDNMTCIVNPVTKKISSELIKFSKDFGFSIRLCKGYSPQTKGKVESANRFMNRLIPYNNEFEDDLATIW
jgi:transposase